MNIWMTLKKAVDFYPTKKAVVDGDQSFTYAQTYERVAALARFFQARGIEPADRISILEVNSHAYLETYYAAAGIGAVLNPLNYRPLARSDVSENSTPSIFRTSSMPLISEREGPTRPIRELCFLASLISLIRTSLSLVREGLQL